MPIYSTGVRTATNNSLLLLVGGNGTGEMSKCGSSDIKQLISALVQCSGKLAAVGSLNEELIKDSLLKSLDKIERDSFS